MNHITPLYLIDAYERGDTFSYESHEYGESKARALLDFDFFKRKGYHKVELVVIKEGITTLVRKFNKDYESQMARFCKDMDSL